jgi:hypothetical protein
VATSDQWLASARWGSGRSSGMPDRRQHPLGTPTPGSRRHRPDLPVDVALVVLRWRSDRAERREVGLTDGTIAIGENVDVSDRIRSG